MKRIDKFILSLDQRSFIYGWLWAWVSLAAAMVLVACIGCTPHAAPIDVLPERVEQRVEDLRFPCDICGQPAKMCEQENWYRCERCSRPKVRPKVTPKRLERQWVMR